MDDVAFKEIFGAEPKDVGHLDFKAKGITLEIAQLAAVAAITIIYRRFPLTPASGAEAPVAQSEPLPEAIGSSPSMRGVPSLPIIRSASTASIVVASTSVAPSVGDPRASQSAETMSTSSAAVGSPSVVVVESEPAPAVANRAASSVVVDGSDSDTDGNGVTTDGTDSSSSGDSDFDGFENTSSSDDNDDDDDSSATETSGDQGTIPDTTLSNIAMCGEDLPAPEYHLAASSAERPFDGETPPSSPSSPARRSPVIKQEVHYLPDIFESVESFKLFHGCHPNDFTVAHGVAAGMTDDRARIVERAAFKITHGPQLSWRGEPSSSSDSDDDY
jgi:hypothetical protein